MRLRLSIERSSRYTKCVERSGLDDHRARNAYFLARGICRSVIDRFPTLENFPTLSLGTARQASREDAVWTSGATGVAVGFLLTDLEKVSTFLRPRGVPWILGLLAASITVRILLKLFAVRMESGSKFYDQAYHLVLPSCNSLRHSLLC